MARETREVREKRLAEEAAARFADATKDWTVRLMNVMVEYATLPQFSMRKHDHNTESPFDPDEITAPAVVLVPSEEVAGYETKYVIPLVPTNIDVVYNLEEAERMVLRYEEKAAEERRQYQVRVAALNKLNDEEKRLLGLK